VLAFTGNFTDSQISPSNQRPNPHLPFSFHFQFVIGKLSVVLNDAAIWKNLSSPRKLFLIAGPCVIENEKLCLEVASSLKTVCKANGIFYVFKASFDKANRTSVKSFRGPGLEEGLKVLARVRAEFELPVLTDVHNEVQAKAAAEVVDILQIPAFLCRQTDLIEAAVETGKIVNLKKGQFLSPTEMGRVAEKAKHAGSKRVLLTERGTTFGYNNLVADMRSIPIMKSFGCPVVLTRPILSNCRAVAETNQPDSGSLRRCSPAPPWPPAPMASLSKPIPARTKP
jgi:3-deoxy-8-phosphooctulonate synthase